MGSSSSPPASPDYVGAAKEQGAASERIAAGQTAANRPTINTPWGTMTWDRVAGTKQKVFDDAAYFAANPDVGKDGGFTAEDHWKKHGQTEGRQGFWKEVDGLNPDDKWTANISLAPEQLEALQAQMRISNQRTGMAEGMLGGVKNSVGQPIDFSKLFQGGQGIDINSLLYGQKRIITPEKRQARTALARGADFSADDIRGYAKGKGWMMPDGSTVDPTRWTKLYSDAAQFGVDEDQLANAFGWKESDVFNFAKENNLGGLVGGNDLTAAQIRQFAKDKSWMTGDAFDGKNASALYDAAREYGVSGRQLDEAFGWDKGTADKWVSGNDIVTPEVSQQVPGMNFNLDDFLGQKDQWRQRAQNDALEFLEPLHTRDKSRMENQLANMGIQRGSEAWNNDMMDLGDRHARDRLSAFKSGQEESALQFGQGLSAANFGNSAIMQSLQAQMQSGDYNQRLRAQQMMEMLTQRNAPLNEMNAFLAGQQITMPTFPGFGTASAGQPGNTSGALSQQYGGMMDQFSADQARSSQNTQAGVGAAGTAAMLAMMYFSDRRLKRDIELEGQIQGVNVYSYEYVWGGPRQLGVMAQEVPWASAPHASGFLMVDYSKVWK